MILYLCKNQTIMILDFEVTPLEYAQSSTKTELKKIIKAVKKGEYDEWSDRCRVCFEKYLAGHMDQALWWSNHAELIRHK